ncbi:MAG: TerC family protein [Candidatus Kapabacteria bacterium]|nr:TerC family protein [Candidatus Kapabacteria bacterium]
MSEEPLWMWIAFCAFIVLMLWLDLTVFNKKQHTVSIRESLGWTAFWISLAAAFNVGVYYYLGSEKALEFMTGYLIEESLSIDNLFVILLIFGYFKVKPEYQHKVLFWGIFGALVMRMSLIIVGVSLLDKFHWLIYIFGGFLIFTGLKMAIGEEKELHPEQNPVVRLFKLMMPVTSDYRENKFFVMENGRRFATPLFIVVLIVEATDLVFAVDSIPAILAVSRDPFIVYTSNAFAILGLRSLFFALAGIMNIFHYIKYGLAVVLTFIGVKMVIMDWYKIPIQLSLLVVAGVLAASVVLSLLYPKSEQLAEDAHALESDPAPESE